MSKRVSEWVSELLERMSRYVYVVVECVYATVSKWGGEDSKGNYVYVDDYNSNNNNNGTQPVDAASSSSSSTPVSRSQMNSLEVTGLNGQQQVAVWAKAASFPSFPKHNRLIDHAIHRWPNFHPTTKNNGIWSSLV